VILNPVSGALVCGLENVAQKFLLEPDAARHKYQYRCVRAMEPAKLVLDRQGTMVHAMNPSRRLLPIESANEEWSGKSGYGVPHDADTIWQRIWRRIWRSSYRRG
jgi:hypothetical protein